MQLPPRYETPEAMDALTAALQLPPRRPGGDWALDAADADRIVEFCEFYDLGDLSDDEKFALMVVIVASLDDYLHLTPPAECDPSLVARVEGLLRRDFALHRYTVLQWCRFEAAGADDAPENGWSLYVSPLMRRVWADNPPAAGA